MSLGELLTNNAYFVLQLMPDATLTEIDRASQKWLDMLALSMAAAAHYETPIGPRPRTEQLVRDAVAVLRDPAERGAHTKWFEIWQSLLPDQLQGLRSLEESGDGAGAPIVREALYAFGYAHRVEP